MTAVPVLTDDPSIDVPAALTRRLGDIDRIRQCNKSEGGPCGIEQAQKIQRDTQRVLRLVTQLCELPKEQIQAYIDAAAASQGWDDARKIATVYLALVKRHAASDIAKILHLKSRNPVVGKIHRMGLAEEQNEETGMTDTQRARAQEKSFEARQRRDPVVEAEAAARMAALDPATDEMMLAERALRLQASGEKARLHCDRFGRVNHGFAAAGPLHRADGSMYGVAAMHDTAVMAMYYADPVDRTHGWRIFAQTRTAPAVDEHHGNSISLSARKMHDAEGNDVYLITGTTMELVGDDEKVIPDSDMPDPDVFDAALRSLGLSGMGDLLSQWDIAPTAVGPGGFVFGNVINVDEVPVGMAIESQAIAQRLKAKTYGGQQHLRDIAGVMRQPGATPRAAAYAHLAKQHASPVASADRVDPKCDVASLDQLFV